MDILCLIVFLHVNINRSSPLSYVSSGGKHAYAWWSCKYTVWVEGRRFSYYLCGHLVLLWLLQSICYVAIWPCAAAGVLITVVRCAWQWNSLRLLLLLWRRQPWPTSRFLILSCTEEANKSYGSWTAQSLNTPTFKPWHFLGTHFADVRYTQTAEGNEYK
jgi:hypothetical protein